MAEEKNNYSARYKQFAEWLKKRYDNNGAKEILMALFEVEKFLFSTNKIKNSIFELSSEKVGYALTNARNNRGFRLDAKVSLRIHQNAAIEIKHFVFEKEKEEAHKKKTEDITTTIVEEHMENNSKAQKIYEKAKSLNNTFESLFNNPQYNLLRDSLVSHGINTIEELKKINLWKFMNSNSLYTIQQRLKVNSEIAERLSAIDGTTEVSTEECTIQYGNKIYSGETPSKAFLQFITEIASKYPLRFRNLIGVFNPETKLMVISAYNHDGNKLKLSNPEVYIDSKLTIDQLYIIIPWVEIRCFIPAQNLTISGKIVYKEPANNTENGNAGTGKGQFSTNEPNKEPEETSEAKMEAPRQTQINEGKNQKLNKFPNPAPYQTQIAEKNILKADLNGVSFAQLQAFLSTTLVATKEAVALSPKIIQLDSKLYHEDAFVDFEEGADQIEAILDKLLQKNNGIATMSQLTAYVRSEMDMFLNDNDITEQQAIFDFARHLFEKIDYHGKHYVFKSNMYISLPEISADSNNGIIQRYAREKGTAVSFDEIKDYLDSLGLNTGNLRGVMKINSEPIFFVYQENEYLLAELIHMDDYFFDRMKSALQNLFSDVGDHIIIRAIQNSWYSLLPSLPAGLEWTPLLLQQIVDFYPQILGARTIAALDSQSSNALHSMIVAHDSWIQDFHDVVAVFLHEEYRDRTKFEADELRHILVDNGMIIGNQLYLNMHKALGRDSRFIWDTDNANVTVRL